MTAMRKRPVLDLQKLVIEQHARRIASVTDAPTGIQWFAEIQFPTSQWFCDRSQLRAVLEGLTSMSGFGDLDVFATGYRPGTPFENLDEVFPMIAMDDPSVAVFAHGEARMTLDVHEAEVALELSFSGRSLRFELSFGVQSVARYTSAVLDDPIAWMVALRERWPDVLVWRARAFPTPIDGVKYCRTRPQRIANVPMNAIVHVVDRDIPADEHAWTPTARALAAAPPPPAAERIERGRLVILRWVHDPSDPRAVADACSRHEQWIVGVVPTRLAPGWNEAGDRVVFDQPRVVDVTTDPGWETKRYRDRNVVLVAESRSDALDLAARARARGIGRVVYRDADGKLWDPRPPGDWIPGD